MDEKSRRIVETAIELAERDGFAAVRLRDIADLANVALGTVYKRFASKEAILVAAMAHEGERLLKSMSAGIAPGETPSERATAFYSSATRAFVNRPKLARAMLRAIAAGDEMSQRVASLHALTTGLLIAAIEGSSPEQWRAENTAESTREIASILQQVWFASLVGWSGGAHDEEGVVQQVMIACRHLL